VPAQRPPSPRAARPNFTPGYGIERRLTKEMLAWPAVQRALAKSRNYWIVTASGDGAPHAAPVWGLWFDGSLCFSTDPNSRKGRNLAANPRLVVHLESGDDAVILTGRAERITDPKLLNRFARAYKRKYAFRPNTDDPNGAFFRLRLASALAWKERNFPKSASKWSF